MYLQRSRDAHHLSPFTLAELNLLDMAVDTGRHQGGNVGQLASVTLVVELNLLDYILHLVLNL